MPVRYGMVGGKKFDGVQKCAWEGAETRRCPKCGFLRRAAMFTEDSRWCRECTDHAREERRARAARRAASTKLAAPRPPRAGRPPAPATAAAPAKPARTFPSVDEKAVFTPADAEIYGWVREHCGEGCAIRKSPQVIAAATGYSVSTVRSTLHLLSEAGRVSCEGRGEATLITVTPCEAPLRIRSHRTAS